MTFALAMGAAYCMSRLEAREQAPTVPVAALEKLLPAPAGWTRVDTKSDQVVISPECSHPVALASFTQGDMQIKISLADSGLHPDSLMALAPMIVMLPEGYSERIPPATKVERLQRHGMQIAERWDERKGNADITMLVTGRFVVSGEGRHLDSLETLRALVDTIDVKRLAELK
jgi:hypothetical protein